MADPREGGATGPWRASWLSSWVLGLVGFLALAWWAELAVQGTLERQLGAQLETIVEADVAALKQWLVAQRLTADSLRGAPGVELLASELIAVVARGEDAQRLVDLRAQLDQALERPLEALGIDDYALLLPSAEGEILVAAGSRPSWVGLQAESPYLAGLLARVQERRMSTVGLPVRSRIQRPDATGTLRLGVPTMASAAPVLGVGGEVVGALVFHVDPSGGFSEILQLATFGETGETYAFDGEGRLLSKSRFEDELRELGLLSRDPGVSSVLAVELRDPGADLRHGQALPEPRPLTRVAQRATAERRGGVDVSGYRDYRGVRVVGAWRWIDELELGVVTEVDYAEAYAAQAGLRSVFRGVLLLAGLAGFGLVLFMTRAAASERARQSAERTARRLGQYTLEEKLGEGGFGAVYRARHALLQRPTALKIVADEDADSQRAIERFEREVQATCRLTNPHTIAVYDFGQTPDGRFFYAMEYLDGVSLADLIDFAAPLPVGRAVYLLLQACESLAEAHAMGLLHRDLKPDNIYVCVRGGRHDFVKVLDFGLVKQVDEHRSARLTLAGTVVGTPLYMAPEQIRDVVLEPSTDVYALGAVAYHMLTGTPPFLAESVVDVLTMHTEQQPERPGQRIGRDFPGELEDLILECLEKDPSLRPPDAGQLLRRLRQLNLDDWCQDRAEEWWAEQGDAARAAAAAAAAAEVEQASQGLGTIDLDRGRTAPPQAGPEAFAVTRPEATPGQHQTGRL